MKKIYSYFAIIALAALAAGCAKEFAGTDEVPAPGAEQISGDEITFVLSVPVSPDTKTSLGAKNGSTYPVYWSEGDVVTLNGTAADSFVPAIGNTTATATFKLSALSAPYNFLYRGVSGQSNQVSFPATQTYVAGGFDPAAMPMYASIASRTDNVVFSYVGALLKFSITGDKKIDSVTLTAADAGKSLSGNFTIGATGGLLDGSLTPASGGATLIYSFGGHIQLSDEPFVFCVAIPAGTYEGGITLDIVDNNSGHMTAKVLDSNATKTIASGTVREFENMVYIQNKENNLIQIWNAETLQDFATRVANGESTLNARLTPSAASIDASGLSWTPVEDYKGTFDGNGKTISGLTQPLFGTLKGVVKNLTLNSTISETSATIGSIGMFAKRIEPSSEVDDVPGLQNCTASGSVTYTPASALENNCQVGGLVGNNVGGTITGCTNNATVTLADNGETNGGQPSIGGVAGRTQKGGDLKTQGEISGCTNNGTVILDSDFSNNVYIGGVLGYQVEKAETMSGCNNSGLVKVTADVYVGGALHIAGVAGMAKGRVENCTNTSEAVVLTEVCTVGTYLNQGGVIGRINATTGEYSGLTNSGAVSVSANSTKDAFVGGVVGRSSEGAGISGFTNTNTGTVTLTSDASCAADLYVGGIVSKCIKPISDCINNGAISNACPVTAKNCSMHIGGIAGAAENESMSSCHNTGTVSNTANSEGCVYVGGICGINNNGCSISSSDNTGNVSNEGGSGNGNPIMVGGVTGSAKGDLTGCSNGTASSAGGAISNSGTSAEDICLGGVAGNTASEGNTLNGCYNKGAVENTGNACNTSKSKRVVAVGGLVGWSTTGTVYLNSCYNSGAVSNSGKGAMTSTAGARIGGLIGCASGGNVLTGTSSVYNYNNGTVTENSSSPNVAIGGVCGYSYTAASDFAYAKNLAGGVITIQDGTKTNIYVGGVIAMCDGVASSFNYASNAGNIWFGNLNVSGQIFAGGVHGAWTTAGTQTVTGCVNSGSIKPYDDGSEDNNLQGTSKKISCVGGISGVGAGNAEVAVGSSANDDDHFKDARKAEFFTVTGKTFTNCSNSGEVYFPTKLLTCAGGVIAWTDNNPSGCVCTAVVNAKKQSQHSSNDDSKDVARGAVGGVVGFCDIATISNIMYNGSAVGSNTSDPILFTGGLVGASAQNTTFVNCKVGGKITGSAKNVAPAKPGLFCCGISVLEYNFTNCVVKSGSQVQKEGSTWNYYTISTSLTIKQCAGTGRDHTLASGGTLPSIGSID